MRTASRAVDEASNKFQVGKFNLKFLAFCKLNYRRKIEYNNVVPANRRGAISRP